MLMHTHEREGVTAMGGSLKKEEGGGSRDTLY